MALAVILVEEPSAVPQIMTQIEREVAEGWRPEASTPFLAEAAALVAELSVLEGPWQLRTAAPALEATYRTGSRLSASSKTRVSNSSR